MKRIRYVSRFAGPMSSGQIDEIVEESVRNNEREGITGMLVATGNNNAAICMSIRDAARGLVKAGQEITEGLLNHVEVAIRAYDPCLSCATHALGQMPLQVEILDAEGAVLDSRTRDAGCS